MQGNARWVALSTIIAVAAIGTWALSSPWIDVHGEAGKVVRSYSYASHYESSWGAPLAGWTWFGAIAATAALGFAMLVGMRRNVLPVVLPAALAVLAAVAAIGIAMIIHFIGTVPYLDVNYDSTSDYWSHQVTDFKTSTHLDVALASAIMLAISAGGLFRMARGVARANAKALATVDHDLAVRDGDLVPPSSPEEDIKL